MNPCPICQWPSGFHDPEQHGWRRHTWREPHRAVVWPHCSTCGTIRRYDDKNPSHCKGPAPITLREIAGQIVVKHGELLERLD